MLITPSTNKSMMAQRWCQIYWESHGEWYDQNVNLSNLQLAALGIFSSCSGSLFILGHLLREDVKMPAGR